jgi:hypothetical protein
MGDLPSDPNEYKTWESGMVVAIERLKSAPLDVAIPKLGVLVGQLSTGTNVEKGDRPVFRAAQSLLLSIPGHAQYYQDKIESLRA